MNSKFTIQSHFQNKRKRTHWDLRVLNPLKTAATSWAIPKVHFPEEGEKVLAIRTFDHKISYMMFHGYLDNGDKVDLYDHGDCEIIRWKKDSVVIYFKGENIKGLFIFIKLAASKNDIWLILRAKKDQRDE